MAQMLGRDLDDPRCRSSHAAIAKALGVVLDRINAVPKGPRRLASITSLQVDRARRGPTGTEHVDV
jgi:hypothetical protein